MTSHEFARKLLEGPDLLIVTPKVTGYVEEDASTPMMEPAISKVEIGVEDEVMGRALLISYISWKNCGQWKPTKKELRG